MVRSIGSFHSLHLPINTPSSIQNARLTLSERRAIAELIHGRIKEKIPVPYLTHESWFTELKIVMWNQRVDSTIPIDELTKIIFYLQFTTPPQNILIYVQVVAVLRLLVHIIFLRHKLLRQIFHQML